MPLPLVMTVPAYSGWKIEAHYYTPKSKFDTWWPIFIHPTYQNIHPDNGLFVMTQEQARTKAKDCLEWLRRQDFLSHLYTDPQKNIHGFDPLRIAVTLTHHTIAHITQVDI